MPAAEKKLVVVTDYDYEDLDTEREIIQGAGHRLIGAQCKSEDEVIEASRDAHGVICQYAQVGAKAIDAFTRCEIIARYGTGVDIVDVEEATRRHIQVTNVPNDWCENEVADHAMALLMTLARKVREYDRMTRAGAWRWQSGAPIHRLQGSTLGLISFGAIAQAIAARGSAFGMRIIAHDPYVGPEALEKRGVDPVSFDEVLRRSDYLVVQAPLTKETRGLIGEAELQSMKPTAVLINTARGPIVDDEALYRALTRGWIGAAGLDDLTEEPAKLADWRPVNPIFSLENVIVTPHAAYYSEEALHTVRQFAAEEVVRVLGGEAPRSPVNRP